MKKIEGSIVINKPIAMVSRLFLDSSNLDQYQDGFVKKKIISGIDGEEGCISTLTYVYGSRELLMEETVVTNNLPDYYEAFYHHQHMDNKMICRFKEIDSNKTSYSYEYDYTRINWFLPKLMSILFPGMYRKQGQKWIDQFKTYIESLDE